MEEVSALILAAGEGKRMKSRHSKVMHKICGEPIINYVVKSVRAANVNDVTIVVGHKAEEIQEFFGDSVLYAFQEEQLGTGHAVMCAKKTLNNANGQIIVLTGDTPMISSDTIKELIQYHKNNNYSVTIVSAQFDDPTGYGRIIRNDDNSVSRIIEHKDCNQQQLLVNEINSGIYCFDAKDLITSLDKITNNNSQKEYYLTDAIEIIKNSNKLIGAYKISNNNEVMGINNRYQLNIAEQVMRENICINFMMNGVTIIDPKTTYIENNAKIGMDTIIYPSTIIKGETVIGENCVLGPNTTIENSKIKDNVKVNNSVIIDSRVGEGTSVGPFAYLRPNSSIGKNARIGDFVEIKNSSIGNGTKVSHLTYIGDADVGASVNFGCGTVVVNYDGIKKHRTIIEDNAFIGCNTNLVSPVVVKRGAYTAAGSTITKEVPEMSLAIARSKQMNKDGWVKHHKEKGDNK